MDLEAETRNNAKDIQQLTVSLTRLTTIVENSEKRHDTEMDTIKAAVQGIEQLNQRMSATISMEKDITSLKDAFGEMKGDVRTARHDMRNLASHLEIISHIREKQNDSATKLAAQAAKIEALETWRDKVDGATGAVKYIAYGFWTIFGGAILAGAYFFLRLFVTHGGGIGGE